MALTATNYGLYGAPYWAHNDTNNFFGAEPKAPTYHVAQTNGQLIYEGPLKHWHGSEPPQGTEVFVGHIPRDAQPERLIPIFERMGEIYEFRLLVDFSKANRGYAFVRYLESESADRAVDELNNYELECGSRIGVMMSVDNRKLFVSKIPDDMDEMTLMTEMERMTPGVISARIYHYQKRPKDKYAIVEYKGHREASLARRQLIPAGILFGQLNVKFEWAWAEIPTYIHLKRLTIFVYNLKHETTEKTIYDFFNGMVHDGVMAVRKVKNFAFVDFRSRSAAHFAFKKAREERLEIDGSEISVRWSMATRSRTNSRSSRSPRRDSGGSLGFGDQPALEGPTDLTEHNSGEVEQGVSQQPNWPVLTQGQYYCAPIGVVCPLCRYQEIYSTFASIAQCGGYATVNHAPNDTTVPPYPPPLRALQAPGVQNTDPGQH